MNKKYSYPFSAVVGQEKMKKALILNLINPKVNGVLISGEKGSGKSVLVRSLKSISENTRVINLPLNITEDSLVGGIDIKSTIKNGQVKLEYGLLKEAHKNILYIDEVNLLSNQVTNVLTEVNSEKINIIQRDGLSDSHPSDFLLVGTMNPEEGYLNSQFIDRFGLFVQVEGDQDLENRKMIIKRVLAYEKDPKSFCERYKQEDEALGEKISKAKKFLDKIIVSDEIFNLIADISNNSNCQGHRADLVLLEATRALASFYGKSEADYEDVKEAASYVLPHRMREDLEIEFEEVEDDFLDDNENINDDFNDNQNNLDKTDTSDSKQDESQLEEDVLEELEEARDLKEDIKIEIKFDKKVKNEGSGKRATVRTDGNSGRYIRYRISSTSNDIAFNATFKVAALNQNNRERNSLALNIKKSDIRVKVREKKTGANILFLVDASGSMGARKRMGAVKGAAISLLNDAYQKRDNVGIIAFRDEDAQVLLNTTRSVDLAKKSLQKIKTGGKTPLALGLEKAYLLLQAEKIRNKDCLQYLIIISDGKANVPLYTDNPQEDVYKVSEKINIAGIKTMVLDTESGFMQYDFAHEMAKILDGDYIKLSKISEDEIKSEVLDLINKNI